MEDMNIQVPLTFDGFIDAIQTFLRQIPVAPPADGLCTLVTSESTEALANLLDGLADLIDRTFLSEDLPFGFLAQIERLTCIIRLLADRVRAITCPNDERCLDLLYEILCVLVEALAVLVGIVIKLITLGTFLALDDNFFECLACSLIGEISLLEESVKDLSCLIIALISCDIEDCTPCYVPTQPGRRPRPSVNIKKTVCSCKKH